MTWSVEEDGIPDAAGAARQLGDRCDRGGRQTVIDSVRFLDDLLTP